MWLQVAILDGTSVTTSWCTFSKPAVAFLMSPLQTVGELHCNMPEAHRHQSSEFASGVQSEEPCHNGNNGSAWDSALPTCFGMQCVGMKEDLAVVLMLMLFGIVPCDRTSKLLTFILDSSPRPKRVWVCLNRTPRRSLCNRTNTINFALLNRYPLPTIAPCKGSVSGLQYVAMQNAKVPGPELCAVSPEGISRGINSLLPLFTP